MVLERSCDQGRAGGHERSSDSLESDDPAVGPYQSIVFEGVGGTGLVDTMVIRR
jgi:hypothetical protein